MVAWSGRYHGDPFTVIIWGDEGRLSIIYHIQYCCGSGHTPLGYSGGGWGRSPVGICQGSPDPICFVLWGWRDPVLPNSGQAPGGTRRADGPFIPCRDTICFCQYGGNDMPTLSHLHETFRGILHTEYERGRPIDMGDDSRHGANLGGSITVWPGASKGISQDAAWTECGIYNAGRFSERGKVVGGYSIHHVATEYGFPVHCYAEGYGALIMEERPGAWVGERWWEQEGICLSE